MKMRAIIVLVTVLALVIAVQSQEQNPKPANRTPETASVNLPPATATALQKRVETFLRNLYAWGPSFALTVGPIGTAPIGDLLTIPVRISKDGQSDSAVVYVSKDGRYLFRGELLDMNADPAAEIRKTIHLDGYPSKGPADAKVVLVEFADFECPSCRQLDTILRNVLPQYPQVRFIFKDFPLEQVHPWAMTAALAGRCALNTNSEAFWKLHDAIYDNQDLISPENAFNKLTELATAAGVDSGAFHSCLADPKMAEAVRESIKEGTEIQVNSTPTVFVNGSRLIGPDQNLLKQYLDFELQSTHTH